MMLKYSQKDRVVINDNLDAPLSSLRPGLTGVIVDFAKGRGDYVIRLDDNGQWHYVYENEIDRLDTPLFSGLE